MAIAIADTQRTTEASSSTTAVTTPGFATTVAVDDYIVVWCAYRNANGSGIRTTVADSTGNTYTSSADAWNDPVGSRFFYTKVAAGKGGSGITVTATKAVGQNVAMDLVAFHITGADTTTATDGAAVTATGTGTNGSVAMNSTTIDQDILICGISLGDDATHSTSIGTVQATPAWSAATKNTSATLRWESDYATFATSTTLTTPTAGWPSMTNGSARAWSLCAIAIKGTAGAAGGHPTMRRWGGIPGMASSNSMGRSW